MRGSNNDDIKKEYCFRIKFIKQNGICNKLNGRIKERSNSKSRRTCDDIQLISYGNDQPKSKL